jgi:hypothetical protein
MYTFGYMVLDSGCDMSRVLHDGRTLLVAVVAAIASGCVDPSYFLSPLPTPTLMAGTQLPLETLAQGELCYHFEPEVQLLFATSLPGLETALSRMFQPYSYDSVIPQEIFETDFTQNAVVAALRQCKGSGGYDVVIDAVVWREEENRLLVYTELWDRRLVPANPASTGYYHMVRVPWTGPPAEDVTVELVGYPMLHLPDQ